MKLEKGSTVKDIISFQVHRNIVNLYKKHFEIIEDLQIEHESFISKLKKNSLDDLPLDDLNYFTSEKYDHIRKRILDSGNDCIREIEKVLELVDINVKENE
tara:strand:+ start:1270 stop:1572 length:303 start_codon:yes stop_codon:yes gene_type:complete